LAQMYFNTNNTALTVHGIRKVYEPVLRELIKSKDYR